MAKARQVHHLHSHAPTDSEIDAWIGYKAMDEFGRSVGKIEDVFRVDGKAVWLLVKHRRNHHFLAPVRRAVGSAGSVFLPYTQETIEAAPEVQPGTQLSQEATESAVEHYGLNVPRPGVSGRL